MKKKKRRLISECLKEANKKYPRRTFSKEADKNLNQLLKKAEAERIELNKKGIRAEVFREEPFTMAQDDLDFHVYLLIWQNGWHKKRVTVEEILTQIQYLISSCSLVPPSFLRMRDLETL